MEASATPKKRSRAWDWALVASATLLACALLVLLWHPGARALCRGREARTRALMHQIQTAIDQYNRDFAMRPPADGQGSQELVRLFARPGPTGNPYLELGPNAVTPDGHFRNYVWDDPPRNRIFYGPGGKLWAMDCRGRPDGINNWER